MLLESVAKVEVTTAIPNTLGWHSLTLVAVNDAIGSVEDQDILPNDSEDEYQDPIGPSVLDNMELAWFMSYLHSSSQPHLNQAFWMVMWLPNRLHKSTSWLS